jgi:hypothetical protein
MSVPLNPNPSPEKQPGTVRIPAAPPPPPPTAARKTEPPAPPQARGTETSGGTEFLGKPQLPSPEIKLSTPPPPPLAPPKPAPLRAPRSTGSIWGVRIGMFAGVALSLALLYWSVFVRLLPVTAEHNLQARQMTRLADELELLRRRWSPTEIEEIKVRYAAARESLFKPEQEMGGWETQILEQARIGTLDAKVKMGAPQPAGPIEGISAITAEVSLQPNTILGATLTPYARVLKFTEALTASPKRLDLIELSVTGDSNSISQAQAVVQLLAGEKKL